MESNSEDIKKVFEQQLEEIKKTDDKSKRFKLKFLNIAAIIIFLFTIAMTFLSITNYLNAKNKANGNVQTVIVKEN